MSPLGAGNGGLNFQPSTFSAHAFVAAGLLLARSVWVIQPYRPFVGTCFCSVDAPASMVLLLAENEKPTSAKAGCHRKLVHCTKGSSRRYGLSQCVNQSRNLPSRSTRSHGSPERESSCDDRG